MVVFVLSAFFVFASFTHCLVTITDSDLQALTEKLFNKDYNNAGKHIILSTQGRTNYGSKDDLAPQPLLTVDSKVFEIPTVNKLLTLYDNYVPEATLQEDVTPLEISEESAFLTAVLNTTVMSELKSWLQSKGLTVNNDRGFREHLEDMWFTVYPRGYKKRSSSGFEHVFLGELKNGEVSGFHNWLFFNHEEKSKKLNYLGWRKIVDFPDKRGSIIKATFNWNGNNKPTGTIFVGTSPELELALYTLCALARPNNKCPVTLGGKLFNLQTYTFTYKNNVKVISGAYPIL